MKLKLNDYRYLLIILVFGLLFSQHPSGGRMMNMKGTISGTVVDSLNSATIEYVSISVTSLRSGELVTGGVTDEFGNFRINSLRPGKYELLIEFIGYDKKTIKPVFLNPREGLDKNIGTIALTPGVLQMDEIQVTEEAPLLINTIDKMIFNVEQNKTSIGGTASDVLENVPSVDVDIDGNISLRGSENVRVLVDGKPSGLTGSGRRAILDNIPASTIESVEVITNPSAKYDPDGMAGIINLKLKKNRLYGFNGNASVSIGDKNRYNASAMINYRTGPLNLYSNYSWRQHENQGAGWQFKTSDTLFTESNTNGIRNSQSQMIKFGADYNLTEKLSLVSNVSFNLNDRTHNNTTTFDYYESINPDTIETEGSEVYKSSNHSFNDGNSLDWTVGLYKDFENPTQKLSIEVNQTQSIDDDESTRFDYYPSITDTLDVIQDEEYKNTTIQFDYTHSIDDRTKFEIGGKSYMQNMTKSEIENSPDLMDSMSFQYDENIYAGYLIASQQLNDLLGIQIGLRAEFAETNIDTGAVIPPNTYQSLFPSGHLQSKLTEKVTFQLSYSRRVNRPHSWHINPFKRRYSPIFERQGNPYLKPEYIDSWDVSYLAMGQMVSVYVKNVEDMIRHYRIEKDNEPTLLTYKNLGNARQVGIELVSNFKPLPFLSLLASVNAFESIIYEFSKDVIESEDDLSTDTRGIRGRVSATFSLPTNIEMQLSTRFRTPMEVTQGTVGGVGSLDIAIEKTTSNEKGTFVLKIGDVLDTRKFSISSDNFESWRRWQEGPTYLLSFSYRFGDMKDSKRMRRGSSEMNGGMDAEGMGY